jgi:hypothetical protein
MPWADVKKPSDAMLWEAEHVEHRAELNRDR